MKKLIQNLPVFAAVALILTFSSCKKADNSVTSDDSISAQDHTSVSNAMDATTDDASVAADQQSNLSRSAPLIDICGGTASYDSLTKTITVTYDGSTVCHGVIRSGTITVTLTSGTHWRDTGAVLTVNFNVKVTDAFTLGSYTLTGTHTITNEDGRLLTASDLALGPVARRHQGSMAITFANGAEKTWTFDRTRTWTLTGTLLNVALSTENANSIEATGTTRYGETFTATLTTPLQSDNNKCSNDPVFPRWRYYAGEGSLSIAKRTVTVLFGTDPSGNSIGTATYCPAAGSHDYGYFITYSNSRTGVTLTKFVSYWN